ncbi:hypothetical protein HDU80_003781 [Chytriomyces hyalinus]|nr:hypothetical protein HDU80_003781 [Chytriomyces hyalinus]
MDPQPQTDAATANQEKQDNDFILCETEFQTTLESLQGIDDLAKFRTEYEKMHKAVLRSRHHAMVVLRQREELEKEYRLNADLLEEGARLSVGDQVAIRQLKDQISNAEGVIDTNNKNEENLREELRQLRLDTASLTTQLKQGVGLSVSQERTLNELIATKDNLTRELESEFDKIVSLRNSITEVTDKIRITDQLKGDREHQIYDLKERNAEKKSEIDSEMRNKERLERDLRELRIVVAVKSQEVRVKQDAVNRATDDISILESQIRTQKQMLEKLVKAREALLGRTAKLQTDCSEQISLTNQLIQENDTLAKELKEKEHILHKNKAEVKKVNRMREALTKKNRDLEDQRLDAEHERKTLRAENESKSALITTTKRSIDNTRKRIEDLQREYDLLQSNTLKTTTETAHHADTSILFKQTRHNIEVDLARENKEISRQLTEIKRLEADRTQCMQESARLQALCIEGMQRIKQKELEIFEFKKKMIQADTKLKHKQNLYEAVQSDRNLHAKHLIQSQGEISEMKRKLKIMNFQINGYKEDINAKYEALAKEDAENAKLVKDIEIISDEVKTLKNQNELAQSYIRSQLAEKLKLNQFVKEADLERSRQENALQVLISERDNLSSQLISQNEELSKAYNQIKTQQSSLTRSELFYKEKLKAIQTLISEIHTMRLQDQSLAQEIAHLPASKQSLRRLTLEITTAQTRMKALQDQLHNPINVHRWRKLEGSNPKAYDMIQLLHTLQKQLISKTKELQEKEGVILEQEQLYLHLKGVLGKQVGPEAMEQVDEFQRVLKDKNLQLKHMSVELDMYHAQVKEYKHALEGLNRGLKQVKEEYFDLKRSGLPLPKLPRKVDELRLPPIPLDKTSIVAAAADVPPSARGSAEARSGAEPQFSVSGESFVEISDHITESAGVEVFDDTEDDGNMTTIS